MAQKPPYVTDAILRSEIDAQELLADNALAAVALAGRDHLHPLVPTLTAVEARMHWLGLQIEDMMALMEYLQVK